MRIVQLSDIHLSSANKKHLTAYYLEALIKDLEIFHQEKPIDIILLTGDLVDKGGNSLGKNPYSTFNDLFIDPIRQKLNLQKSQILFIPGNHDIQRELIHERTEFFLGENLNTEKANDELKSIKNKFNDSNKRIKKFKIFEKDFHNSTANYEFSNNESLVIVNKENIKIGFILINDSWRCSANLKQEQHFIGTDQLYNSKAFFTKNNTSLNIAVFHHPLEVINSKERDSIENILQSLEFDIAFFGHSHKHKYESIIGSNGGIVIINGRSAFNDPEETLSKYQPGYNFLDLDLFSREYTIYARKYIEGQFRFDKDTEFFPDGKKTGILVKQTNVPLSDDLKQQDKDLPSGYSADVKKIVKLLIGKSLYPNQYIFVRELIQNSVDACSRIKERHSELSPKIIILINTQENSFEIIDEGDGMSKRAIREHFAIIGKSISQEFNEALNNVNLISQFGIGFISTFIVAKRILVSTKSEDDGLINFEIEDVFKGFNYDTITKSNYVNSIKSGTSIKIFLKKAYHPYNVLHYIKTFCRHIESLEYYLDGTRQMIDSNWNIENGVYFSDIKNSKFEYKLTVSPQQRSIIASNGGFLIKHDPLQIIPPYFPITIGGEVVFKPKSIDLDLSRSNIIESDRSIEFKRDISISLKVLFRNIIESPNRYLKDMVLNYLQYYLINYETIQDSIRESYIDFYSKKELIKHCSDLSYFNYKGEERSLSDIMAVLNIKKIETIYLYGPNNMGDLKSIVTSYLQGKENLVIFPQQVTTQFRETGLVFSSTSPLEIIIRSCGFNFVDIDQEIPTLMNKIIINRIDFNAKLDTVLLRIESRYSIKVEIAHLGLGYRLFLEFTNKIYLNFDHPSIQQLINNINNISDDYLEVYLLGVLGANLLFSLSENSKLKNIYSN